MPATVKISSATWKDLSPWHQGEALFAKLLELDSRLAPETLVGGAPSARFNSVDSARPFWGVTQSIADAIVSRSVVWERNRPVRSGGKVSFSGETAHGEALPGTMYIHSEYIPSIDWEGLFLWCIQQHEPIAAILHVLGDEELTPRQSSDNSYSRFYRGVGGGVLKNEMPNLAWGTYFGPQFASEIDFKGLTEDGLLVSEMAGGFLLRYSAALAEVLSDFRHFSNWRAQIKSRFRSDLFTIKWEPGDAHADDEN